MYRRAGVEGVLGLVILVLRRLCNWTQDELGDKTGISGGAISFYEQGEVIPDREKLERIATATGTTLADIDRLAAEIFRVFEKMAPAALVLAQAEVVEMIANKMAEDFRVRAIPEVRDFLTARRAGAAAAPAAPEEARREAQALWECLEKIGTARFPNLATAEPDLLGWAVCELLADKSAAAAPADADRALELANLALWAAARVPAAAGRLRCEAYAWAAMGHARRAHSEPQEADNAFVLAFALWQEGATGDPGFLDGSRLLGVKAAQ